jgi:competence protein ComEC
VRTGMLLFCLGLASVSRLGSLPALSPLALLLLLAALTSLLLAALLITADAERHSSLPFWYSRCTKLRLPVLLILCFALGVLWALLVATTRMADLLPAELEGEDFWVTGRVVSLPVSGQRNQRFDFYVTGNCFRLLPDPCVDQPDVLIGNRIRLSHYGDDVVLPGQQWLFRVRLNRPHGLSNPGGADFEASLFQQRIVARGYVRDTPINALLDPSTGFSWAFTRASTRASTWAYTRASSENTTVSRHPPDLQSLRFALAGKITQATSETAKQFRQPGLLRALVLGDRTGISTQQWALFSATGTNHLMVISGLHIGFVALSAYWLVNLGSRASTWFLLRCPAQRAGAMAAIIAALIYAMLAGFSLPTQRALVMVTVLMSGNLLGRRIVPSYSLLLAATLILIREPLSVTQAGFWLSFSAVAALLLAFSGYGYAPRSGWARHWANWGKPQWVVSAGLLVPLMVWTGQVSLVSPLVNILAIPLVSLVVVPLALTGSLLLWLWPAFAVWLLWIADMALSLLMVALATTVSITPALWQAPALTPLTLFCVLTGSVVLLLPRGLLPRRLVVVLWLPLLWPPLPHRPEHGQVQLQFLDVGQGLAIMVHTRHHHLLFDTGPGAEDQFDAGQSVILPYLRRRSVNALDTLIVSHWHQDHSGGLESVLQAMPVQRKMAGTLAAQGQGGAAGRQRQGFEVCRRNQQWQWDGVDFRILHPDGERYRGENDNSCVLMIRAGEHTALLTGDIERAAEQALLRQYGNSLSAQVLQAAHHGSQTSSSARFLEAVQPALVVVSAGYRNRFGHPSAAVLQRFAAHDTEVFKTFSDGAIQLELGGAGEVVVSGRHRWDRRRYWHSYSDKRAD